MVGIFCFTFVLVWMILVPICSNAEAILLQRNAPTLYEHVNRKFDDSLPFKRVKSPSMHCRLHIAVPLAMLVSVQQLGVVGWPGSRISIHSCLAAKGRSSFDTSY